MNYRRFLCTLTVFLLGGLTLFHLSNHRSSAQGHRRVEDVGFQVGERAPDFTLPSLDGKSLTLSELRGRPVLLNFWATWCAPCRVEMPWLVRLDEAYRAQGLQVIGIAVESGQKDEIAAFVRERGVQYEIVLGNSATLNEFGGVRFMPQSFFIDREGRITKVTAGITDESDLAEGIKALLAVDGQAQVSGGRP